MNLRQRNGIWTLDYRDALGRRQRKSLGTRDKAEAERLAQDLIAGRDPRSDVWTLRKALEHTFETVWQHQKSWETRASVVKVVADDLGHLPVSAVTFSVMEDYVLTLYQRDLKPATINRRLAAISKALNVAAKRGKLAAVPPIPLQPENNKRTRWLTEEEEQRLLVRCDVLVGREMELMRDLLVFLVDTGARLGEALKLWPEHILEQPASVRFLDTKSTIDKPKHRTVPLTARALRAAQRIARANRLGAMLNKDQIERRFDRVRKAAGLADVNLHALRHTCASRLLNRGAKLHEVRDWLGHSSIVVTERYAHLMPSSLDHLTELLDVTHGPGVATVGHSASNVAHFPGPRARKR